MWAKFATKFATSASLLYARLSAAHRTIRPYAKLTDFYGYGLKEAAGAGRSYRFCWALRV